MHVPREDILTPANAVTLAGLALTLYGSIHLETALGFWLLVLGRSLDMVDGPVARRTHTSRFGIALDAVADKLSLIPISVALLVYGLAPVIAVWYVVAQNAVVAAYNLVASHRGVRGKPTKSGKLNVFLQMSSLILFAGGSLVSNTMLSTVIAIAAWFSLGASIPLALNAVRQYAKRSYDARRGDIDNRQTPDKRV
ncbi:hypothetical protein CR970_01470 [Candidatus Saccharibacteria bacterium]|nr:MAG: hypothetical protein CR970_01470 [Candidatus Saccharibacteria bacterium]